jgi:PTS system galactitol-specific IIA component
MSEDFDLDDFRVSESLVAVHMNAATMEATIRHLADILIAQGYVRPSYTEAALAREATCPTGLPTPGVGTAIPHAGVEHTLRPGIAIGTLAQPVKFGELGDPNSLIDVSVIFMLSVTQPDAQVYLLQSVIEIYKDEVLLRRVQAATEPGIVAAEVNAALAKVKAQKRQA